MVFSPAEIAFFFNNTLTAAHLLIDNSMLIQDKVRCKPFYSPMQLAKEICTVKVCGPRQSGHSRVALTLCNDRFEGLAAVVAHNEKLWERQFARQCRYSAPVSNIESLAGIQGLRAVIVDTASCLSKRETERVYERFIPNVTEHNPFFFVFLE